MIDNRLVSRLYGQAKGERWRAPLDRFAAALEASAARAFAGRSPSAGERKRYLRSLHLEDLALACACAAGDEEAWGHFVLEHRPLLYKAAAAIDPGGGARDLADSLYADLFGLGSGAAGEPGRQPLFRYFHGRSSLATWLRAVLAQRHVDRLRTRRRVQELPGDDSAYALSAPEPPPEPDRQRYQALMSEVLAVAIAALAPRDRLRLSCYYAEELTLAQTGRLLGEHEATVSRQLARARRVVRAAVEQLLRTGERLTEAEVAECFACVADDVGPIDLRDMFAAESDRKESAVDRSTEGRAP